MADPRATDGSQRRFRFLDRLGSGAFGEVHLAELHTDDDFVQTLAVKWLHAQYSTDAELVGRLRDEARLLGLLQHPNVVRVNGLTRIDGRIAVLMEAVDGRDLAGLTAPPRAAAEIVGATADALHAAWTSVPPGRSEPLQVVHRDIKPSNIMVTRHGQVKVMDFGVARATFDAREAQTRSQQYGTARYMAPERWLEGVAQGPSDIFSLGVTLVELAGGAPVSRPRLSRQGFQEDMEAALARLGGWPALQALARSMVAFDPDARPDADAVSQATSALELPGPSLKAWARTLEPATSTPDALTGTVFVEDTSADTFVVDPTAALTSGETLDLSPPTTPAPEASPEAAEPTATDPIPSDGTRAPPAPRDARSTGLSSPRLLVAASLLGAVLLGTGYALSTGIRTPSGAATTTGTAPTSPEPANPGSTAPTPESPEPPGPELASPEPVPPSPTRPEPLPQPPVSPEPPPRPEPARPGPLSTRDLPSPRPPPSEPPPPDPTPAPPPTVLVLDIPRGASVQVRGGGLAPESRGEGVQSLQVPTNTLLEVRVTAPDGSRTCTIPSGTAPSRWRVSAQGCEKSG